VQYQTFRGADLREALSRVKQALGPNAVIESTRQISNGRLGGLSESYVEVTAGSGEPSAPSWSSLSRRTEAAKVPSPLERGGAGAKRRGARGPASPKNLAWLSGLSPAELERELGSLRMMLEELNLSRPPKERALALLYEAGFEGHLARELATGLSRAKTRDQAAMLELLKHRLADRLRVAPHLIQTDRRQMITCVGPTGAGKTTTLAKLAARAKLDHGRSVGIITFDTYRVGAIEQWQRYAQLLGVPFSFVRSLEEFENVANSSVCDLLLVDTSGRSSADRDPEGLLPRCLAGVARHELSVLAVVPAWLRARDAEHVIHSYDDLCLTGAVITKLDESVHHGGVIHGVVPHGLPVTYTCHGPRVPEDIQDGSVEVLLEHLLFHDS